MILTKDPYTNLAVTILLRGIMEQSPEYVLTHKKKRSTKTHKNYWAGQAKDYVKSEEFENLCNKVGMNPSILRKMTPFEARYSLYRQKPGRKPGRRKIETTENIIL